MVTYEGLGAVGKVRWGIVGCGDVTEVKSGPAFQRVPGSSISAVMRRSADKAKDYAQRHGVPRWTSEAAEIIDADDVDAVYVATPPSSHAEYVLRAAEAGKPVYVEKPLARTYAEGKTMVAACGKAGVPLYVAYYRRALPRFEFVRERLQDGSIGEPTLVHMELRWPAPPGPSEAGWRWDPEIAGNGLLHDLGSHGLDLLDHWFGPIEDVSGFSTTKLDWARVADQVVGVFRFGSGVLGTASWNFAGADNSDRITVSGTRGSLVVPLFAEGPVLLSDAEGNIDERHIAQPRHVQEPLIAAMVDELLGRDGVCPSTGASALRTQAVLDRLSLR